MKILNYVEVSFEGKPSFIILMDDGLEYISNGCVFVGNTEKNLSNLCKKYACEAYISELRNAPSIEFKNLTNASYMFSHSNLTDFSSDMSNITNASYMFSHSSLTDFSSDMSNVTNASYMFFNSNIKK